MRIKTFHLSDAEKKIIERAERHSKEDRRIRQMVTDIPRQRRMQILFHLWASGYKHGSIIIEPYDRFMERTQHYPAIRTLLSDEVIRRHVKGRVLDLSCGTGAVLEMLLEHCPGVEFVHANDMNSKMLEMARTRLKPLLGKRVTFSNLDIEESVPSAVWPRQEYDVVLISQTWHLIGVKSLFEGHIAEKALKPGVGKVLWIDEFPARFSGERGVIDLFFDSLMTPQSHYDFRYMLNRTRTPHIERNTDIDGRHDMYAFLLQPPDPQLRYKVTDMLIETITTILEVKAAFKAEEVIGLEIDTLHLRERQERDSWIRDLRDGRLKDPKAALEMRIRLELGQAVEIILGWQACFTDPDLAKETMMSQNIKRIKEKESTTGVRPAH
ncbi:TPA: class I SAM-dependent methyltransferase [Candidatus Micrarchaeota archaeon]|nr:class I SAM-dependent methyltransferase [Candidatus Micrarchaeota archaeon]